MLENKRCAPENNNRLINMGAEQKRVFNTLSLIIVHGSSLVKIHNHRLGKYIQS